MAVKYVNIVGISDHIEEVAKVCGSLSCFHPDDVTAFYKDTKGFTPFKSKSRYFALLESLNAILDDADFKTKYTKNDYFNPDFMKIKSFIENLQKELGYLCEEQRKLKEQITFCNQEIENVKHFVGMDFELEKASKTKYVKVKFGRIPKNNFIKLESYNNNPYLTFFLTDSDDDYCWGIYVAPINKINEVDKIFSGIYFEEFNTLESSGTPDSYYAELLQKKPNLEKELKEYKNKISDYKEKYKSEINSYYSKLKEHNTFGKIISHSMEYKNYFILVGWVPADSVEVLEKKLSEIESVELEFGDAEKDFGIEPPVKLKNFFLARPFEFYTEMYGVPNYNELDPTKFIALTYTILFGIMFADLGQGFLLLLIAIFMWKRKKMTLGKILIPCSLSAMFFGTAFGSFFGFEHALNPVFNLLGFSEKPINFEHAEMKTNIILFAVVIGVVLVITAMFLNIFSNIKQKNTGEILFGVNGIAGLVFYSSLLFGLVMQMLLGVPVMNWVYVTFLVLLPLLMIYLKSPLSNLVARRKNWQPESWGEYLVENFFEMFEVLLGYVTNTMSFLRVGAFVLVHTGLMTVVFELAKMAGEGTVGYFAAIAIGNVFVLCLESLLVGIQVLRLEYYEMFSRFYKGNGTQFKPVKIDDIN